MWENHVTNKFKVRRKLAKTIQVGKINILLILKILKV